MEYTIAGELKINQNAVKAAILNGSKIIRRAINQGQLKQFIGNQEATIGFLRNAVKNQLETALSTVSGEHEQKNELLKRLEIYLLNQMTDHA
jgi:hypothetical protein